MKKTHGAVDLRSTPYLLCSLVTFGTIPRRGRRTFLCRVELIFSQLIKTDKCFLSEFLELLEITRTASDLIKNKINQVQCFAKNRRNVQSRFTVLCCFVVTFLWNFLSFSSHIPKTYKPGGSTQSPTGVDLSWLYDGLATYQRVFPCFSHWDVFQV